MTLQNDGLNCVVLLQDKVTPSTKALWPPDRKNGINLIPSRYHWDQLDAKVIVLDINFPVRLARHFKTDPTETVALCFGYAKTLF
jgi:hypothetical protein